MEIWKSGRFSVSINKIYHTLQTVRRILNSFDSLVFGNAMKHCIACLIYSSLITVMQNAINVVNNF